VIILIAVLRKRRREEEEETKKDERVELKEKVKVDQKPSVKRPTVSPKPKLGPIDKKAIDKKDAAKDVEFTPQVADKLRSMVQEKQSPTLTSEFPLDQKYRPPPEQMEVIPVAKTAEKPKLKVHFCDACNKPFKVKLPIEPDEDIICPWCDKINIINDIPPDAMKKPIPPEPSHSKVAKPVSPPGKPAMARPVEQKNE
jgi:hypothetical protein